MTQAAGQMTLGRLDGRLGQCSGMTPESGLTLRSAAARTDASSMGDLQVQVSPDAAGYITEHGGELFIRVDDHGLLHWRLEPPTDANSWSRFDGEGITICVDESALDVSYWRVVLDHLPWKRIHVYSDVNLGIRSLHMDERGVRLGDGHSPSALITLSAE